MYVALHLVYKCLQNEPLPEKLPISLVHPTKRHLIIGGPSRRQSSALNASATASPVPRYGNHCLKSFIEFIQRVFSPKYGIPNIQHKLVES